MQRDSIVPRPPERLSGLTEKLVYHQNVVGGRRICREGFFRPFPRRHLARVYPQRCTLM
jgi:hypothetical protein